MSTQRRNNSNRGESLHNCIIELSHVKLDRYPRRLTPMQEARLQCNNPTTNRNSPKLRILESSQAFELSPLVGGNLCWIYASKSSISLGSAE